MRRLEAFSGVRVLTYSLMSNHFHLLCEVPQAQELSEAELLDRIQAGYGPARRQALGSSFVESHFYHLSTSWVTNVGALPRATALLYRHSLGLPRSASPNDRLRSFPARFVTRSPCTALSACLVVFCEASRALFRRKGA